jgi:hypothetical protein
MRPKFTVFALVLLACVLAAVFLLRPKQRAVIQPNQETVQPTNQPVRNSIVGNQNALLPNTASPTNQVPFISNSNRIAEGTTAFVDQRNKPIDFYCRFIDQNDNPVPGVIVKFSIEKLVALDPAQMEIVGKYSRFEKITDADGRIEMHGEVGDGIGIGTVTKDGYELSPKAPRGFGGSSGSYENPVVFKMWKTREKAQLIGGSKFWGIIPDGRVYTIDFLQQTKAEGENIQGDIKISIIRPSQIPPRIGFDWSFSIEAINGGLIEASDDFMYLAPESGYQSNYRVTMVATNAGWKSELDGLQFYLKSRDGQVYGSIKFDLIPNYNKGSIFNVNWAVNPNASRNLQP